jgi:pyridoxamine 5'-phosphate oxidase family protein
MSAFTAAEIAYLQSQRLGRLATVNAAGEPHVVPVGFRYNAELDTIDIGGHGIGRSKKFHDVQRDGRTAFVVDDVPSTIPGGRAEALAEGGKAIMPNFDAELIRITPAHIAGWGIDGGAFEANSRAVK